MAKRKPFAFNLKRKGQKQKRKPFAFDLSPLTLKAYKYALRSLMIRIQCMSFITG